MEIHGWIKKLTEAEVATIISNYRKLNEKVEEAKNTFTYITESEERLFRTNTLEKLKTLDKEINK